jgi:hypothetical protein
MVFVLILKITSYLARANNDDGNNTGNTAVEFPLIFRKWKK